MSLSEKDDGLSFLRFKLRVIFDSRQTTHRPEILKWLREVERKAGREKSISTHNAVPRIAARSCSWSNASRRDTGSQK
jgi:hypothetical protein